MQSLKTTSTLPPRKILAKIPVNSVSQMSQGSNNSIYDISKNSILKQSHSISKLCAELAVLR